MRPPQIVVMLGGALRWTMGTPHLVSIIGGPASGKTTLAAAARAEARKAGVLVLPAWLALLAPWLMYLPLKPALVVQDEGSAWVGRAVAAMAPGYGRTGVLLLRRGPEDCPLYGAHLILGSSSTTPEWPVPRVETERLMLSWCEGGTVGAVDTRGPVTSTGVLVALHAPA